MSNHKRHRRHNKRMAALRTEAQAPQRSQQELEDEAQGIMGQIGSAVMGGLRRIDDSTQAFTRDHLLRLPTDGSMLEKGATLQGPRNFLGNMVFAARKNYEGDNTAYRGTGTMNDNIGLGLSRALQGGTITAAGASLVYLTNQFGNNAADYQEPNQLSL